MGQPLKDLQLYFALSEVGEAIDTGRESFLEHSPRNTNDAYENIYVRLAADYCRNCRERIEPIDADVVCSLLGWPALDMQSLHQLPERLRYSAEDFLPMIESLNYRRPLLDLIEKGHLPTPIRNLLLFLGRAQAPEGTDLPSLHAQILSAAGQDIKLSTERVWPWVSAGVEAGNRGFAPFPYKKGPPFH